MTSSPSVSTATAGTCSKMARSVMPPPHWPVAVGEPPRAAVSMLVQRSRNSGGYSSSTPTPSTRWRALVKRPGSTPELLGIPFEPRADELLTRFGRPRSMASDRRPSGGHPERAASGTRGIIRFVTGHASNHFHQHDAHRREQGERGSCEVATAYDVPLDQVMMIRRWSQRHRSHEGGWFSGRDGEFRSGSSPVARLTVGHVDNGGLEEALAAAVTL